MQSESPPTAIVSGGSRGMGLAVAQRFAELGGRVAVLGRSAEALGTARQSLQSLGSSDVLALTADVTDERSVAEAFATVGEVWSEVNVLVNAVGPSGVGRFDDIGDEVWRTAFEEGVMSAVHCIRYGLPLLRAAEWGRIVNLTALSTKHQSSGLIAYTTAKSALASLTKNLARTLAPEGILVNAVAPGAVLSEPIRGVVRSVGGDPEDPEDAYRVMADRFGSAIDLGRVGLPHEIAEVVLFCASRKNTYMTGANLNVDGGSDFF
ncbi:MAG TPA: SDR family oxidoreductase [Acidimicrobiales bacterium]|nr:SDR family oxidoreductase [Acidimicrobiales bacterium]